VQLQVSGETVAITPKAVVITAGTGTKHLVRMMLGELPDQLRAVTHAPMHMVCIRGPADVLRPISFASLQHGLMSVAHLNDAHDRVAGDGTDEVTWYVTPAETEVSYDVEPSDLAEATPAAPGSGAHNRTASVDLSGLARRDEQTRLVRSIWRLRGLQAEPARRSDPPHR
jgi:hypothetical protein